MWLFSPAGPPPEKAQAGLKTRVGAGTPGGSGKSWWLVSGEDLGKTHLSEIPDSCLGARKEAGALQPGGLPHRPVRPTSPS